MTLRIAEPDPDPVASAAVEALMDARWESSDLLSRRSAQLVPDLLRGRAAELATSAAGRDQVLSVALDAAARDLEKGRTPLGTGALFFTEPQPEDPARENIRKAVLRQGGIPLAESQRVAENIEQRCRRERIEAPELSQCLAAEARLHEALWDDPRLPANNRTRLVMLCSVPRLMERAQALNTSRCRRLRSHSATGDAFRALDVRIEDKARERDRTLTNGRQTLVGPIQKRGGADHTWSAVAGWFLLVGLFAVVLVGLLGIG